MCLFKEKRKKKKRRDGTTPQRQRHPRIEIRRARNDGPAHQTLSQHSSEHCAPTHPIRAASGSRLSSSTASSFPRCIASCSSSMIEWVQGSNAMWRAHVRVPALEKHNQNSTRRPRERESENGSGRGKKARNLDHPPSGPHSFGAPFGANSLPSTHVWPNLAEKIGHMRSKIMLAKRKRPTLANPILANPILVNPIFDLVCVMLGPQRVGPGREGRRVGPKPTKSGAERSELWFCGALILSVSFTRRVAKVVPRRAGGWGPNGEAQNFASPLHFRSFRLLSGCLVVEFWWCSKRQDHRMCTSAVLGLSCEAPAAPGEILGGPARPRVVRRVQNQQPH